MSTMFRHRRLGVGCIAHAASACGGTIDYFLKDTLNKFCVSYYDWYISIYSVFFFFFFFGILIEIRGQAGFF